MIDSSYFMEGNKIYWEWRNAIKKILDQLIHLREGRYFFKYIRSDKEYIFFIRSYIDTYFSWLKEMKNPKFIGYCLIGKCGHVIITNPTMNRNIINDNKRSICISILNYYKRYGYDSMKNDCYIGFGLNKIKKHLYE